jgi:uncharacterized protein YjiS (DUF1127 family)
MRFSLSCGATLLLFNRVNIPIFHSKRPALAGSNGNRHWPDQNERRTTMFAALVRFIQEWKRYNQSLNELSRLGDRELADIGISRSDIPRVAWNNAHRG